MPTPTQSASDIIDEKIKSLPDPAGLFNSSLEGNVRRAIDIHENEKINESAFKNLIRAAIAHNLTPKPAAKKKPRSSTP